jgi:potassium uptake TrkH family protein
MMTRNEPEKEAFKKVIHALKFIPFWISLIAEITVIYDFGFDKPDPVNESLVIFYIITLFTGAISIVRRYFSKKDRPRKKVHMFDLVLVLFFVALIVDILEWTDLRLTHIPQWTYLALFLMFVREFSTIKINYKNRYLNPAQLFVLSFLAIIFFGTILLTLPHATHNGISFIDALFTSTSAVCVTGLIVVDTGSYFTNFGQAIILILIQLGGIGVMTFTSYFSYFFRGATSFENELMLRDMANEDKLAEVLGTLKKIIIFTFVIEALGAFLIFISLTPDLFNQPGQSIFFSIFHSISGFCNAGFSTLPNSLMQHGFSTLYSLHLILAMLFIIGGLGFPIVFNFFTYLRYLIVDRLLSYSRNKEVIFQPGLLNVNTRIVFITTLVLLGGGTLFFYLSEYNNSLNGLSAYGKIVTSFFSAATPRTAGFNTVDIGSLKFDTLMIIMFLMFVGASPASTGGGVKTSTIALGVLNIISLARGKNRIEVFRKEIAESSVHRAFAIISLSILIIGIAVFLIESFDSKLPIHAIVFESISAYSTVGLSTGITSQLGNASKVVLIFTMFIGRVSMLTIMVALLRKVKHLRYAYPVEKILIN